MTVIAKANVRGSTDSLEIVNPSDIHGNGSNVPVQDGDIAFVVTLENVSYMYRAVDDADLVDDGTRVVQMSSGTIAWKRMLYADKLYSELPKYREYVAEDGIVPEGYESIAHYIESYPVFPNSGALTYAQYAYSILVDEWMYTSQTDGTFERLNLTTLQAETLSNSPGGDIQICHLNGRIYAFNSTNDMWIYTIGSDSWTTHTDSVPMTVIQACAAANGYVYVFGSSIAEGTVYDKAYRLYVDDVGEVSFLQMTPCPRAWDSGLLATVTVGSTIYVMSLGVSYIRTSVYHTVGDGWDVTIPDKYEVRAKFEWDTWSERPSRVMYYDASRNGIYYVGRGYTYYNWVSHKLDLDTGDWDYGWHAVQEPWMSRYSGAVYDSSTDTVWNNYGGLNSAGAVYYIKTPLCGKQICRKI